MRDETLGAPAPKSDLKPANANPWYVLMTLYGEQDEDSKNTGLQKKNRDAWNAWVASRISIKLSDEMEPHWNSDWLGRFCPLRWSTEMEKLFRTECTRRGFPQADVPTHETEIRLSKLDIPFGLNLTGYLFCQPVTLAGCTFASFSARAAIFAKLLTLEDNKFLTQAAYYSTKFLGEYYAAGNEYCHGANFRSAVFNSAMTSFHDTYKSEAAFSNIRFKGAVNFEGSRFLQTHGESDHDCLFQNCEFHAPTNFRSTTFKSFYPDFHGVVLHERTLFSAGNEYWPKHTSQRLEQARNTCSAVRHILAKQSLPEDEHFFFRREMQISGEIGSFWQQLPYRAFGLISDYGHSIARPLIGLAIIWTFGFACFWGYLASCCVPFPAEVTDHPMGSAMALSFSNLFPLFGFGRTFLREILPNLPTSLAVLSGLQTIISLPLLFFLGLGLRQRFRLR
ncbi:hypothetical protein [Parasedimentitalea psychrophila]|uniref:Pentapeptide repeat-containing protein n=1 Tax=Parasedimentitalea psychrophila TaxID=2997337 RepID=A0A9Y2KUQ1_9RHOB|nr:hypothetical protein [Parasedimentitalea psychrophila]WIY23501.1 hypothetical protein QPJ95_12615 [Parasedimentitalea psychrophila]